MAEVLPAFEGEILIDAKHAEQLHTVIGAIQSGGNILTNTVADLLPVVGPVKAGYEAITGKSFTQANTGVSPLVRAGEALFVGLAALKGAEFVFDVGKGIRAIKSTRELIVSASRQLLDLSGAWRNAKFTQGGIVYLLKDAETGEVLKVGITTSEKFVGRFEKYVTAGNKTGRKLEVEVFETPLEKRGLIEGEIRKQLGAEPGSLPWDNTDQRLGRPGSGVPKGTPDAD